MLNAAIVGLGWWGKRIVGSIQEQSRIVQFVHAVSLEPDSVRDFAALHRLTLSTGFAAALADPRVQAVVLATPHSLHVEQIMAAAAAGKHVLCEKPLALCRGEAERAVAACQRAGVLLGIGTNRRYVPAMQALRNAVASGKLGRLLHIDGIFNNANSSASYAAWRARHEETPGGPMTAAGVHMLDALVSLAGPVARVQAQLVTHRAAPDPLDAIAVILRHTEGLSSSFVAVRPSPMFWRVHAFGTEASAEALGETDFVLHRLDGTLERNSFEKIDSVRASVEAFAHAACGGASYPVSTATMLDVVSGFEAILQSLGTQDAVDVSRGTERQG